MYHHLVYLLDLCTFSYHLHSQTLIWPVDPYYEQWSGDGKRRKRFMTTVHEGAKTNCPQTSGPGQLVDWGPNADLDPIISDYSQIDPRRPGLTRPTREKEGWILYDTPVEIADRIKDVYVVRYDTKPDPGLVPGVPRVRPMPLLSQATRYDWLYCFEGGTGSVKLNAPSWSIMGFVLAREDETVKDVPAKGLHPYDVYIVFRGSRSGDPRAVKALTKEKGNPDWVTDMDFGAGMSTLESIPDISQIGNVGPGFAQSVKLTLPNVMACLGDIQKKKGYVPRTIHVTGHSLGAALAVHFASAVRLGSYRPDATLTPKMPDDIKQWPWSSLQLVPFSLPVVGGETFHEAFNLTVASRRVYLKGDPVTQTVRGYSVGKKYEIVPDSFMNVKKRGLRVSTLRHEPYNIREYLIKDLQRRAILRQHLDAPLDKEPWKVFKSFKHLLRERPGNEPVSKIVGANFNVRLQQLLELVEAFVANDAVKKDKVEKLRKAINYMTTPAYIAFGPVAYNPGNPANPGNRTITQVYGDTRGIYDDWNDFIGSCIFLSAASKGNVQLARAEMDKAPFRDLKMK